MDSRCESFPVKVVQQRISQVTLADFVDFDFSPYPRVRAWIELMHKRPGWDAAFAGFSGLVQAARNERRMACA